MQAVGRDAAALELLGQVEGEHDQGELALAVGLNTAVVALEHHVLEVDRSLAGRAHVDDPRRGRALDQRQQASGEQEGCEVVDREGQLVAVGALLTAAGGADPGVVDEHVDPGLLEQGVGKLPDLVQRGEIRPSPFQLAAGPRPQLLEQRLTLLLVSPVEDEAGAARGQLVCEPLAEAIRRPGDHDRPLVAHCPLASPGCPSPNRPARRARSPADRWGGRRVRSRCPRSRPQQPSPP